MGKSLSPKSNLHPGDVFVQLSPSSQIRLVRAGLDWIVTNYHVRLEGKAGAGRSFAQLWKRNFDSGVYDQRFMDELLAVHARVASLSTSYGRLRFTSSFQVAACALAARIALKRHRLGYSPLNIPRIRSVADRALNRLEAIRKRAKRSEVRQCGIDAYRQQSRQWKRFVVWLRVHVASCERIRPERLSPGRRRIIVTQLVDWTRQELLDRKAQLPGEPELRRLVRLALSYVRRGRKGYDVKHLLHDKVFASGQLATFVTMHMEKPSNGRKS